MLVRDCFLIGCIASRTLHIFFVLLTSPSCPCIGRIAYSHGKCHGCQHRVSSEAYSLGGCSFRVSHKALHCRQGRQGATDPCHSRQTSGTSSSDPDAEACPPVPSSSSLHRTVPLAAIYVPILRMDSLGWCASPRSA